MHGVAIAVMVAIAENRPIYSVSAIRKLYLSKKKKIYIRLYILDSSCLYGHSLLLCHNP